MRPSTMGLLHLLCILRRLYTPPAKRIIPFCLSNKLRLGKDLIRTHMRSVAVFGAYTFCARPTEKSRWGDAVEPFGLKLPGCSFLESATAPFPRIMYAACEKIASRVRESERRARLLRPARIKVLAGCTPLLPIWDLGASASELEFSRPMANLGNLILPRI